MDVATGWVECQAVWGKGRDRVGGAVRKMSKALPFDLLGLDSDNGSEFINHHLYAYCQRNEITFTRSRPYKKNDNAHAEQRQALDRTYRSIDPVRLEARLDDALEALWDIADRRQDREASVTATFDATYAPR